MDNISDTNYTRATKLWPKVVCDKTFLNIQLGMTLCQGQDNRVVLKIREKMNFYSFLIHKLQKNLETLRWQVHLGEGLLLRIFVVAKVFGFGERNSTG